MAGISGKTKQIYDTLKGGGAHVGTEQEFNNWFWAKGDAGYQNRKRVFSTLKSGGADVGARYEEFRDWLGVGVKKPATTPQPQKSGGGILGELRNLASKAAGKATQAVKKVTTPVAQQAIDKAKQERQARPQNQMPQMQTPPTVLGQPLSEVMPMGDVRELGMNPIDRLHKRQDEATVAQAKDIARGGNVDNVHARKAIEQGVAAKKRLAANNYSSSQPESIEEPPVDEVEQQVTDDDVQAALDQIDTSDLVEDLFTPEDSSLELTAFGLGGEDAYRTFQESMSQLRDRIDYYDATGEQLESDLLDEAFMAPTVARDENGEIIRGEDGKPLIGASTEEGRVATQRREKERLGKPWLVEDQLERAERELKELDEMLDGTSDNLAGKALSTTNTVTGGLVEDAFNELIGNGDRNALKAARSAKWREVQALKTLKDGSGGGFLAGMFGDGSFVRGAWDAAKDLFHSNAGLKDLPEAGQMFKLYTKLQNGVKLTNAEQKLADAIMSQQDAEGRLDAGSGWMYRAGKQLTGNIPFMAMIAMTGGFSGVARLGTQYGKREVVRQGKRAIARAAENEYRQQLGKAVLNQSEKRLAAAYGKSVAERATLREVVNASRQTAMQKAKVGTLKAIGYTLGETAAGFKMAYTVGLPATASDAIHRRTGQLTVNDEGSYDFEGGEDWLRSIGKATVSQTKEFATESAGKYFGGLYSWLRKSKIGTSQIGSWLLGLGETKGVKWVSNNLKKAGIQGVLGESLEEEIGMPIDVAIGDMTWEDALSAKTQWDITGGMALTIGAMYGLGLVGHGVGKAILSGNLRKYQRRTEKTSAAARLRFGEEKWSELQGKIDSTGNDGMDALWQTVRDDAAMSTDDKRAVYDYMNALTTLRGFNLGMVAGQREASVDNNGESTVTEGSVEQGVDNNDTLEEEQVIANEDEGYDITDADEKQDAKARVDVLREQVGGFLDENAMLMLDEEPIATLKNMRESEQFTDDQVQQAADYVNAKARYNGMVRRVQDDIDAAITESDRSIDERVAKPDNGGDGMIHPATLKVGDKPVYIVSGNVKMTADGTMVDVEGSDKDIIVLDTQTGEVNFVDAKDIKSVDAAIDPEEERQLAAGRIREEMAKKAADEIDGTQPFNLNDEFDMLVDGKVVHAIVTQEDNGDGVEVQTTTEDGQTQVQVVPRDQLQQAVDDLRKQPFRDEIKAPVEEPKAPAAQPQAAETEGAIEGEQQEAAESAQQTALSRIPVDERGGRLYEQASHEDSYDALVEQLGEEGAIEIAKSNVSDATQALKKLEKKKPTGKTTDEKVASLRAIAQERAQYQATIDYWNTVQAVPNNRRAEAERVSEEEEKARREVAERREEEAKRQAREAQEKLNGVPDVLNDKAEDARARGYRNVNGNVVMRQEGTGDVYGCEVDIKFSKSDTAKGHMKVIEADDLQPSHVNGQRNPKFFIDEAQPKDRTDAVSSMAAAKIASALNPEEITGGGSAYQFSAPTVNTRGEVVQGNNRSDALKLMYDNNAFAPSVEAYKAYLMEHADEFGLDRNAIASMKKPVLVNEIDVTDEEAIRLGQMKASDIESSGIERIDAKSTTMKLGKRLSNFANVLLSSANEEASLSELLVENGVKALKWLNTNGIISDTQLQSAVDRKGNITAEGKMDLQNILKQSLFAGGVSDLPKMFDAMPDKAQKAILSTFMRDMDSDEQERILPFIQESIEVYHEVSASTKEFNEAGNYEAAHRAMDNWTRQYHVGINGESLLPSEKFSNFAIELATRYRGTSMSNIAKNFNDFYDMVQGKGELDMFSSGEPGEKMSVADAIRKVYDVELKPKTNETIRSNAVGGNAETSPAGRRGEQGDGTSGEPDSQGTGTAVAGGRVEGSDVEQPAEEPAQPVSVNDKLQEARSKYPDRVFAGRHIDGSVTFRGEDATLVAQLLERDVDASGEITLDKEEADKALPMLIASGHKVGYYEDNETPSAATGQLQGLEGYSEDDVLSSVRNDIEDKLSAAGVDGVTIKGMAIHGSRKRGDARTDSDLDVVVEYDGDISEDGLFNLLNEEPLEINGIRVDINPITKGKSGTLEQYMERSRRYDAEKGAEQEVTNEANSQLTKEKQSEIKSTAAHFPEETPEEAAIFDKRVPQMSDEELLAYMREDGNGDLNKAYHPSVYDEYDYRHTDEELDAYDRYLQQLRDSGTTQEQAEEMLANWQKDLSRLATNERADLNGQEGALQDYIDGLEKIVPGHDLQEHIDALAALQDNGKDYNENAYDAYAAGRRFGNGVNKELSKKEAIALAHKMVDENRARGGVYILPFLDGVGDSVDLRQGKHIEDVKKREDEYRDKKKEPAGGVATEPQPIGKGVFGNIYDQFKGKVKEAFDFLLKNKSGDVLSVWRRDDVGDIDLVWGDKEKNAGIDHIVHKHVGEGLDFASEQEMIDTIDDIVRNGSVNKKRSKWDKIVLEKDGKIVVIRKNVRDENGNVVANKNWVVTSFDNNMPKSKKTTPAATRATPDSNEGGRAVTPSVSSAGKDTDLFGNAQEKTEKSSSKRIDDFGEKIGGARKDVARSRIRDAKKMTVKDLTTLKKGADDILSQANIIRLYKDGQMDEQTARGFMALNNAANVAMKYASSTGRELIMTKYKDAAVAWEEGRPVVFNVTDEDIKAYQSQFGVNVTEEKARESLDYLITDPFSMFMQTYEAIDYPAVERKLGRYVIVDYTSMKGRHIVPSRPYWVKNGLRAGRGYPFGTMESAVAELKKLCPEVTEKEKKARGEKAEHGLHVTKEGYVFYIKSRNIPGNIYLSPRFWSEKEAQKYLDDNLERLKEREQRLVDALMGSNIGMAEREGVDCRNGKDVTPQDFLDEFGFRGVEFGNWVPQGERQMYLNKTYDAIKDFCAIVGISPRAFSLGGRLGLAFGARGKSRAMAHYEPGKEVINLTRMSGVGSLAHEWFHALDNYLAKQKTGNMSDMATETHDVVREELGQVFKDMYKAMRALDYDKRSRRAGEYWGRTVEEFARLFENYIYNKLAAKETTSPVLVRQDVLLDNIGEDLKNSWPYPSAEENTKMEPYFDKLFDTIQERVDEETGNVELFRDEDDAPIFFSNAEKAVEGIKQNKATAEQWLAMIQKNGGLKAGEDKWLGLSDWLNERKGQSVTKEELLNFIRENQVQIEEVHYEETSLANLQAEFDEIYDRILDGVDSDEVVSYPAEQAWEELRERYNGGDDFDLAFYLDEHLNIQVGNEDAAGYFLGVNPIDSTRLDYTTPGLENKREIALVVPTVEPYNESDTLHFGDAGEGRAVAWVRFGETTDADGNRVLVVDEIQSKRHQEGREKGYKPKGYQEEIERLTKDYRKKSKAYSDLRDKLFIKYRILEGEALESEEAERRLLEKVTAEEYEDLKNKFEAENESRIAKENFVKENGRLDQFIPSAPFEKNWHELAMKRMLRYAAENGYDKVAWTTGEQQAARYNLGDVVDKIISYDYPEANDSDGRKSRKIEVRLKDGETMTMRVGQNGKVIEGRSDTEGKMLSDVVGKELAKRIMEGEGRDGSIFDAGRDLPAKVIDGDGLRIGGEGMQGFYDQILPRFMDKYGKKWGAKTQDITLPDIGNGGVTMHSVDVTPEMKESVIKGQPMFREGTEEQAQQEPKQRTAKEQRSREAFAERQWRRAKERAREWVEKLNISDRTEVYDSIDDVPGSENFSDRKRRSRGWYNKDTGKIVIVLGNHRNPSDVVRTILHEAVAHYGLRKLFGKNLDNFLDNVYNGAEIRIKEAIMAKAVKLKNKSPNSKRTTEEWRRVATEEYLAELAESTDFENTDHPMTPSARHWFNKIKGWFFDMLSSLGLKDFGGRSLHDVITDNELRYILWRSYENLTEPGRYRNVFSEAKDIAMQHRLKVGEFERTAEPRRTERAASPDERVEQAATPDERVEQARVVADANSGNEAIDAAYKQFKEKHSDAILLVHMADGSYRAVGEDKQPVSTVFGESAFGNNGEQQFYAVPERQLDLLLPNLVRRGNKVAIMEEPTGNMAREGAEDSWRFVDETDDNNLFRDNEEVDADAEGYDAGRMTFEESISDGLIKLAQKNKDDVDLRVRAMRQIGGNLAKLRQAMARQREYDRGTVDSIVRLAKSVIDSGFFSNLSPYEVKRLMGMVNRAAGREDITKQAGEVVDLLLNHQLKELANILHRQMQVKGSKLNAKGVEVQGQLDIDGQRMMSAMKDGMTLSIKSLDERIGDTIDRMGSDDKVTADNAAVEYQGLMLARQYVDEVKRLEDEEKTMKMELKSRRESADERERATNSYKEYVASVQDAIRENRLERAEAYNNLISALGSGLKASVERAKEWREREHERIREIQHNANSDLQGVPADELAKPTWTQRAANLGLIRFFMKPLATFDQMLRFMGSKSVNGEGYLWNRFMSKWSDANDKEWKNLRAAHKTLDDKASEVFGKEMRWSDLFSMERNMPTMDVEVTDAKEKRTYKLTQGNLLYIYMVNKMSDGKMKLRNMGISEEDVAVITENIDPRLIELADWLQDEFLVQKRNDYNEVHERMFGAPMAAIENYFPLKINSRSRGQEEDIGNPTYGEAKPSTITGSVIKRTKNSLPLDITGADAFDVVLEHLQQMEHWAAFAEFNNDLNTLLSYKRFRNRVQNMSSARYGSGDTLWKNFKDVCAIAAGVYTPMVDRDSLDKSIINIAKGVTASKIAFRIFTAMKQLLSYPAYFSNASIPELVKSSNPIGAIKAWNWAIENLPGFAERWQSRQAGDNRLKESDADWGIWKNKIVETASRWGMSPNAFVDGLTVAMGGKAVYETKLKKYKKQGYSEEQAKKKALLDASVAYNSTQQSSANAYVSPMQLDRTVASVALTVFRNASMGYQRQFAGAIANLGRKLKPGYKDASIAFMAKQIQREWNSEEDNPYATDDGTISAEAERIARRIYNRSWAKDIFNVGLFGFVLQFAWNMGPYMAYLLVGDDDDKKKDMLEDAAMHALAGGVEGLSGGNVMSDIYNLKRTGGSIRNYGFNLLPLFSDLRTTLEHFESDEVSGWNDVFNLLMQSGLGFNPQTFTDTFVAIGDYAEGDPETGKEMAMLIMRILQVPQTAIDEVYIDELGLSGREAKQLSPVEMAQRYAEYKFTKNSPLTGWAYSDEGKKKVQDKYVQRFADKLEERIEGMSDEALIGRVEAMSEADQNSPVGKKLASQLDSRIEAMDNDALEDAFNNGSPQLRKKISKQAVERIGGKGASDSYASQKQEYNKTYVRLRSYFDLAEDVMLQAEQRRAEARGDEERMKEVKKGRAAITKIRQELGSGGDDSEVMSRLRAARRELISDLGL